MPIIDEDGRIFGVVNVIDALVVLLALAVVAAGVALVVGDSESAHEEQPPQNVTRNATVSVGTVPPSAAGLVQPGTVRALGTNVTVTDVYRSPATNGQVAVTVRVQFEGKATDRGFAVGNTIVRYGTGLTLETSEYALSGRITSISANRTFDTQRARATVEANVTAAVADAIDAGDTQTIAGDRVARVQRVETLRGNENRRTVRVRLRVTARPLADTLYYGGSPLRIGSRLRFATSRYEFQGTVTTVRA